MNLQLQHTLKASWITHFEGCIENGSRGHFQYIHWVLYTFTNYLLVNRRDRPGRLLAPILSILPIIDIGHFQNRFAVNFFINFFII